MNLRRRSLLQRRIVLIAAIAAALIAAISAALLVIRPDAPTPAAEPTAGQTTEVTREGLSVVHSYSGQVDHGVARPITGKGDGVLTWLVPVGETISRGETLYRVDEKLVMLFYGDVPL